MANARVRSKLRPAEPVKATTEADHDPYTCANWKLQVELAERREEGFVKRGKRINKRYREERPDEDIGAPRRMNVLWSNVETLKPSVYGREPVPIAERRFLDRDVIGRVASQILERAMRYEMGDCGFHDTVEQCVKDYLLPGRGVAWLRYKPIIGKASSLTDLGDDEPSDQDGAPDGANDVPEPREADDESDEPTVEPASEKLLSASLEIDYVHWADFLTSDARWWKEVEWVARRLYPSRQDLVTDFGEDIGKRVPLEMSPENINDRSGGRAQRQVPDGLKKAIVYEIWDKPTRKVYTIAKGFDEFLEEPRDDPLNLEGFWPCPRPLFATMTNDTLEPVADYIEYQDQALEIDNLTNRIDLLIKALKVAGVYDSSQKQLARILDEGHENQLIGVPNWAAFAEKGGLVSAISFLPIKEVSDVLLALFKARDQIKQDMYEITGIADVIRGQSDPRETAEAVATKGRFGTLRLQARQIAVARFCRDIIRMMGEVIAEHFPDDTLITTSGIMYDEGVGPEPPQAPQPPAAQGAGGPPGIGHNGGPPMVPMGAQGSVGPMAAPQPAPQHPVLGNAVPMGGPQPSPIEPASPGPPMGAPHPVAPPDPVAQYHMAMAQYQQAMVANQAEKSAMVMKAIALLRQDKLRGFRIDIETDSTVETDANQEKQDRIAFIEAVSKYVEQAFQIGAQSPDAVPMLGKMLLFAVRGFRAGRDLESTIEEFVDKAEKDAKAKQNSPPPPDPKVQAEQAKAQAEIAKAKIDAEASAQDNQREMASKQLDAQLKQQQATLDNAQMERKAQISEAEARARMAELAMQMRIAETAHGHQMEASEAAHRQKMAQVTATPSGEGKKPAAPKSASKPKAAGAPIPATPEMMSQFGPPLRHPDGSTYVQHKVTGQYHEVNAG